MQESGTLMGRELVDDADRLVQLVHEHDPLRVRMTLSKTTRHGLGREGHVVRRQGWTKCDPHGVEPSP